MRLIRLPEVQSRTGLSRSSVYLQVTNGQFPQPRKLGDRAVAWVESEVTEWVEGRPKARSSTTVNQAA
jgi:prophage regulatory protein